MLKKILLGLLMISLLLASGCSKEESPKETDSANIRYEGTAAYYSEDGAKYSMELVFAQPVSANSTVALLNGEQELLSFSTTTEFSELTISVPSLELNVPYTLTVNGVAQRHDGGFGGQQPPMGNEPPAPGEYPDPELPSVPEEPMMTMPTEESQNIEGFQPGNGNQGGFSPDAPPANFNGEVPDGEIPSLFPGNSSGELPPEPFQPGVHGTDGPGGTAPMTKPSRGGAGFLLTGEVTRFTGVQAAK